MSNEERHAAAAQGKADGVLLALGWSCVIVSSVLFWQSNVELLGTSTISNTATILIAASTALMWIGLLLGGILILKKKWKGGLLLLVGSFLLPFIAAFSFLSHRLFDLYIG